MRVAFTTLGCKINQYETDAMRQAAAEEGNVIVPFDSEADVYVINTCSVTAKSDYQCRQMIRAAIRRGEGARVIVTGCYAETRPQEIRNIPGVSMVLGNGEKTIITRYLSASAGTGHVLASDHHEAVKGRTRGVLKIQDGCDSRCTYCIVPLARGASRSVPRGEIIRMFDQAIDAGCPEVVLSGIHIGRYGQDLVPRESLTVLIRDLLARKKQARIRLSSIEPNEVTDDLISMFGHGLCRHLHVPLQSGDDAILRSMNRTYGSVLYRELVETVAMKVPDIAIGADVMVGFPGEGEKEFQNTYDLVEDLPLTHLHVFSYSSRQGTPAAAMQGQVSERIKKERNEALRALAFKKNLAFREGFIGKTVGIVLEEGQTTGTGMYSGLTDNYVRVHVSGVQKADIGREINIRIKNIHETGVRGGVDVTF
jgi:threonylcarbamoyladenosine tRNA methylthiotransferase MtaB